ncbi:MAG: DegQ family serine endoprotease [Limisphaerales bacterium]
MNKIAQSLLAMRSAALGSLSLFIALQAASLLGAESASARTNPAPRLTIQDTPISRDLKAATSVAPVVKKVAPSVVNIYSTMTVRERPNQLFDDPFFRRFFGEEFGGQTQPRTRREQSLGSGVIISSDGYILTANHVVEDADKVKVALASGEKEFDAKVIGTDPPTDTAVLKVDGKNLPAITIADSDKLEVGDVVLAIGNPFGVGQTVTMGIVSALGRGGFGINNYENFIQTDAAINPGNSGGPLVDAEGRLVGINTWIISRSGGFQGLGFAVPINMARYVMERLISDGKVARGYLGLWLQPDMTPELAKQFNLPDMNGALVTTVDPDSPGAKAGFKEGDFVIEFNEQKVKDMRQLRLVVSQTAPGKKVTVKILRDGKERTLTATLGEMPKEVLAGSGQEQPGERGQSKTDALDGVEVTDLDAQARSEANVPSNVRGALVTNVDQDSNAAEAGLRAGDIIIEINRQRVHTADEAVAASEKAKGDRILLRIWRGGEGRGGMLFLSVDNTKRK